jgi:hypothetical protein
MLNYFKISGPLFTFHAPNDDDFNTGSFEQFNSTLAVLDASLEEYRCFESEKSVKLLLGIE